MSTVAGYVWRWSDTMRATCFECGRFVTGAWTCWVEDELRWVRQVCADCAEGGD